MEDAKKKEDKARGIAELIKSLNKIKSAKSATESVVARAKMEIADLKEKASRYDDSDDGEGSESDDEIEVQEITHKGRKYLVHMTTGNVYDIDTEEPITYFSYDIDNSLINSIIQYHGIFHLLICTSPNVFPIT